MPINPRGLVFLLGNILLIYLNQLINSTLSVFSLSFFLYGLIIAFPALHLTFTKGLILVIISAFIIDTSESLPLGASVLSFSLIYTAVSWARSEFKLFSHWHEFAIIQISNILVILAYYLFLNKSALLNISYWHQCFQVLVLSQVSLIFVAPWFFAIQMSLRQTIRHLTQENTTE